MAEHSQVHLVLHGYRNRSRDCILFWMTANDIVFRDPSASRLNFPVLLEGSRVLVGRDHGSPCHHRARRPARRRSRRSVVARGTRRQRAVARGVSSPRHVVDFVKRPEFQRVPDGRTRSTSRRMLPRRLTLPFPGDVVFAGDMTGFFRVFLFEGLGRLVSLIRSLFCSHRIFSMNRVPATGRSL